MNYELLIKETESFISKYMRKHDNPELLFHNLSQTQNIVSVANQLAQHYALKDQDLFIVRAAAWFLYVGYYKNTQQPEEAAIKMAEEFFRNAGVELQAIESIKKCILSTKATTTPDTLLAKIICDANSFYIGTEIIFPTTTSSGVKKQVCLMIQVLIKMNGKETLYKC
ncbi:MAG: hypothetical protein WKF73_03920 [Nocardioidaceae bacterium]